MATGDGFELSRPWVIQLRDGRELGRFETRDTADAAVANKYVIRGLFRRTLLESLTCC